MLITNIKKLIFISELKCFGIIATNEPQLREVREFHKTKFKENPKTQAKHFGFCKFNIFYKTKCNCDLKSQNFKKSLYTAFCETDVELNLR